MRFTLTQESNWIWTAAGAPACWGIPWTADLFPQFQNFAQVFEDYKINSITYTMKNNWTDNFLAGATEPGGTVAPNAQFIDAPYYVVDSESQVFPLTAPIPSSGPFYLGGGTPTPNDMMSYHNCKSAKQSQSIKGKIYPHAMMLLTNTTGGGTGVNGRAPAPGRWLSTSTPNVQLNPVTYVYLMQNNPNPAPTTSWVYVLSTQVDAEMSITLRM